MSPGERIQLMVPIHYDGNNSFQDMSATLSSDRDIDILFGDVYYGEINNLGFKDLFEINSIFKYDFKRNHFDNIELSFNDIFRPIKLSKL